MPPFRKKAKTNVDASTQTDVDTSARDWHSPCVCENCAPIDHYNGNLLFFSICIHLFFFFAVAPYREQ